MRAHSKDTRRRRVCSQIKEEKEELNQHTIKMNDILEQNQQKFEAYVNRQNKILNDMSYKCCGDEWICINVGGTNFETRKQTLI